jgi:hypothetical protein
MPIATVARAYRKAYRGVDLRTACGPTTKIVEYAVRKPTEPPLYRALHPEEEFPIRHIVRRKDRP